MPEYVIFRVLKAKGKQGVRVIIREKTCHRKWQDPTDVASIVGIILHDAHVKTSVATAPSSRS